MALPCWICVTVHIGQWLYSAAGACLWQIVSQQCSQLKWGPQEGFVQKRKL